MANSDLTVHTSSFEYETYALATTARFDPLGIGLEKAIQTSLAPETLEVVRGSLDDWIEEHALPDQSSDRVVSFSLVHGQASVPARGRVEVASNPIDSSLTFLGATIFPATKKYIQHIVREMECADSETTKVLIDGWVLIAARSGLKSVIQTRRKEIALFDPTKFKTFNSTFVDQ